MGDGAASRGSRSVVRFDVSTAWGRDGDWLARARRPLEDKVQRTLDQFAVWPWDFGGFHHLMAQTWFLNSDNFVEEYFGIVDCLWSQFAIAHVLLLSSSPKRLGITQHRPF